MPPTGSTFTDWQQVEKESRLLMNEDFSWSEPPRRRRRRIVEEPIRARRRSEEPEYEPRWAADHDAVGYESPARDLFDDGAAHLQVQEAWDQPTGHSDFDRPITGHSDFDRPATGHSHFDELMEQWTSAYGEPADVAFDLSDPGMPVATQGGRRTVVITGRGDDRYVPAPRRSRTSELRFHERSSFSPDRAALWAVLLGIALVIGAIAH